MGEGFLFGYFPLPFVGEGDLVGYADLLHVPAPVCPPPCPGPAFDWGSLFGPGSLAICLKDGSGNPRFPECMFAALYQVRADGTRRLVGPAQRHPVSAGPGCFYITGVAGECGQPGPWVIVWSWRMACGPWESAEQRFRVQDAVAKAGCPPLGRCIVYGWE